MRGLAANEGRHGEAVRSASRKSNNSRGLRFPRPLTVNLTPHPGTAAALQTMIDTGAVTPVTFIVPMQAAIAIACTV